MTGNTEEKEKCLEKLNQMQKFLPFLDFMIDKIKKKNYEISLECQLSKFQILRSMIAEKNEKYSLDAVVKVEDIIEKLIAKLDFKDHYEKSKENLSNSDYQNWKTSMATSVSVIPSSTTTTSITSASSSHITTADLKPQELSSSTVDLIMKTLKVSVDNSAKKSEDRDKELGNLGLNQPFEFISKTMETDLDKDLDGFDLTDCPNFSEPETSNSAPESANVALEKAQSHDDLLSSSRKKLLKSLQSRLLSSKADRVSSQSSAQYNSACSRNQINLNERKSSDVSEKNEHYAGDRKTRKTDDILAFGKPNPITLRASQSVSLSDRARSDSTNTPDNANLKQRLKEKFSTDICEVYRVPGKSVGGSLRSLKESKDYKKNSTEDNELLKPDKVTEKSLPRSCTVSQSKLSTEKKDSEAHKFRCDLVPEMDEKKKEDKTNKKAPHKPVSTDAGKDGQSKRTQDSKNIKSGENKPRKNESCKNGKARENKSSKNRRKSFSRKESESKSFEVDKLNDDELLEFVKENMQYLPHLAKLKPSELRKAVQSSVLGDFVAREADSVSELSDGSFQDLDEFINLGSKVAGESKSRKTADSLENFKDPHPLASVKIAQVGSDGVAKNVKPVVEPSRDTKLLDEVGDKTHDMDDVSEDDVLDEEDYAQKLIEETTPKAVGTKKKKGLLELPLPDDLFEDISSVESFDTRSSPNDSVNSKVSLCKKTKSEANPQTNASEKCIAIRQLPKDGVQGSRLAANSGHTNAPLDSYKPQRSYENKPDMWPSKSLSSQGSQELNQFSQLSNKYPNETGGSKLRNSSSYSRLPAKPSYNVDPRRHFYCSSEPKSYAEYKRMKQKMQEKLSQYETIPKENSKNSLSDNSSVTEIPKSPAEREETDRNAPKKLTDPRNSRSRDSYLKQTNQKTNHTLSTNDDKRKTIPSGQRKYSDHVENRLREERKSHEEIPKEVNRTGKVGDEQRHSVESEELVSPLEELYRNESKPKTGRGYGIQHFKIPKKSRESMSQSSSKSSENQALVISLNAANEGAKTQKSNCQYQSELAKEEPACIQLDESDNEGEESKGGSIVEEIVVEKTRRSVEKSGRNTKVGVDKDISARNTAKLESNRTLIAKAVKTDSVSCEIVDSSETCVEKVDVKAPDVFTTPASNSFTIQSNTDEKIESSGPVHVKKITCPSLNKTDITSQNLHDFQEVDVTKTEIKMSMEAVKKCEAQVAECDSSMECSILSGQSTGKESSTSVDKSMTVPKEEITQEFVEALIRKSFQSGEGKLLLAHAKLFEKFARKLNSKKLKTIQKIINSESDSSSSSSEIFSEDEKKRKKNKKTEEKSQKSRKTRKRGRKNKKQKLPSSSSSESEETSEEENLNRKEDRSEVKQSETSKSSIASGADKEDEKIQERTAAKTKSKSSDPAPVKTVKKVQKRRRNMEFGKHFSGSRATRKQRQKKMLEKILNESPQPEANQDYNTSNSGEVPVKGSEQRSKPKTKAKVKTELDRLHEDIRSMFLNAGVVTPTGQRMCRILRQTGGNINNLDIVKESARMVEEEKLKKVQTRSFGRNSSAVHGLSSENRCRSQSLDKTSKTRDMQKESEDGTDPKLKTLPRVILQRVDLDNFGYGEKISDDCVSFRRMQGRNTAIRGTISQGVPEFNSVIKNNVAKVFLARNKRKFERLKDKKCVKGYVAKKLMDIVKNLPLKMAKMKHLQICEKKTEDEGTKEKKCINLRMKKSGKSEYVSRKKKVDLELSNTELLNYAFERIRVMYSCKLCSKVTKYITKHYKIFHPDHEVLISRLCIGEAKRARLDAKKNRYNDPTSEENPLAGSMKRKIKMLLNTPISYNCRMCSTAKTHDLDVFKAHVSSHTGEFRFECPMEGCTAKTYSRQDIKFHTLTKHSKNKFDCSKITELYTIVVEENKMFGFLCSVCNFVQLCQKNVAKHISRRHTISENAGIIKINMSSNLPKLVKNKFKNVKGEGYNTTLSSENVVIGEEKNNEEKLVDEHSRDMNKEETADDTKETGERTRKRNRKYEADSPKGESLDKENDYVNIPETKKIFFVEASTKRLEEEKVTKKSKIAPDPGCVNLSDEEEKDMKLTESALENNSSNEVEEECVDLKSISSLRGSDIIDSVESTEKKACMDKANKATSGSCQKIKVGPLEAQMSHNCTLYECYVKGCLFFTRVFDLFEKHIKISHCRTKWDGICEICTFGKEVQTRGENSFRLLTALRHLRLHEREKISHGKLSTEDLIMELKLVNSPDKCIVGDEETEKLESEEINSKEETKEEGDHILNRTEYAEPPFPPKPLLRVRNLLGDRLSTPKESPEENEVVAVSEEPATTAEPSANSMFTIEDVRSLNDAPPEDSKIQIQHVCSLKDSSKPLPQLTPGKTILVRSCPTRKIAIRPEPSALSIDVGQLSVVQAPAVTHPVVLSPLSSTSPIRILSSTLSSKSKFTVKPILVPADPGRINNSNVVSIISPTLSPIATNTTVSTETKTVTQAPVVLPESSPTSQTVSSLKSSLEVTSITPSSKSAAPMTSTTSLDAEEGEEKDTITLQRIHSSPNAGNKRVKDAKIYEEMLTKTKLCHLFKCMGIECSFTCNNECVFRQHIGLHEAQRRLKKSKGIRTIFLRLANKTTRAFYWQQCSYCCEVLSNTNNALSQHILEEHGHCMYQCAFCFYRAVSHSYVEIHQNLAHSQILKTSPRVIYKCKPLRTPPSQAAALEKHGRRQSVRPYHCDQCGRKFFITQDFINHLTTQHQSVTAYTCHICKNLCFKADRLVVHYKLHSYCTYQCAYCLHGTETETEMVFHLCNFHFSQPAVMYVRAFADGQSQDVKQKQMKKKKHISNQLDSLKVIVYESDTVNADCIVEVDADEETPENASESSLDLSAIVAELGIIADVQSSPCVTPLMKELASIGDKSTKNLTVKTLLPNAQFSSENDSGNENCSVLISSGLSTPSDQSDEREMNIPLGQLPLEVVNVHHNDTTPPPSLPKNIASPDKNLKLNEIIVNLQNKDKAVSISAPEEEKQPSTAVVSSAVHKMPPVVLSRTSVSKNVYPSKSVIAKRKCSETSQGKKENAENERGNGSGTFQKSSEDKTGDGGSEEKTQDPTQGEGCVETNNSSCEKSLTVKETDSGASSVDQPLITNVVSLSNNEFDKDEPVESENSSLVISDICSLSSKGDPSGIVINIQSKVHSPNVLKPPVIRVEDFPVGEENRKAQEQDISADVEPEKKAVNKESEKSDLGRSTSPDIIILEEDKSKSIITVTLDSDDERDENLKKEADKDSKDEQEVPDSSPGDDIIRKEMELLRNQIASETDSLLFDDSEGEKAKEALTLSVDSNPETSTGQSLLSPIEEAICSLNKKLQSETEQAQKREEEDKKENSVASLEKPESCITEVPERPRTRFAARDRRKEGGEVIEKNDGDDGGIKKEDSGKCKKVKDELAGKDLFICGNEKCNFAAENDSSLKDHLYVCDLSRESSVLVCPHCSRQTKQFHPYLEHLKYHGQKKYHCGLCSFSSAVDASVSRHVKLKHKSSLVKVLPKDAMPGHLVYYPKNYKVDKVDFEVNGYSPGDEDKLPLQSVYQVNVKCAKCPYFTKVRSNMVRHLKIHVKSVETEGVVVVPSTAPTNPVPCLETKERMFDKMTNLAASSQLAQAKEKTTIESLSPEEEAKLPQFVAEQMRYKCCLPDCNYITVDDGMLKHHIKALHDEITCYSCPHCKSKVNVGLDKIGHHLKHHDVKLYKCAHCVYFHYQKNVVEKHTVEKHPDRRYFVHIVREPKPEASSEEELSCKDGGPKVWKCGLCEDFNSPSKSVLMYHLLKTHNMKSKYRCKLCTMKGNSYQVFFHHFASKHPGEKVSYLKVFSSEKVSAGNFESQSGNSSGADSSSEHFDTTPLWQRGTPRIRHIRGILIEEEEIKTKKSKRTSLDESDTETPECVIVNEDAFYCPLCMNKKKPFYTRNEDIFRTHLYQELNYQQFACILCGKMFVDRKDFDRHHSRHHPNKAPAIKQTKEDHEIKFWVDKVIERRRSQMEDRKRKLSDGEASVSQTPSKKKKEV